MSTRIHAFSDRSFHVATSVGCPSGRPPSVPGSMVAASRRRKIPKSPGRARSSSSELYPRTRTVAPRALGSLAGHDAWSHSSGVFLYVFDVPSMSKVTSDTLSLTEWRLRSNSTEGCSAPAGNVSSVNTLARP